MLKKCLKCGDELHCCVNGFFFVGVNDAKKIRKVIGHDYGDFLDFSKLSKRELTLLKTDDPVLECALRYSLLDDDRILRIKKKRGRCFFLQNGKCEIYSIRPKICRIYPYWCIKLTNGRVKVILHDPDYPCAICDVDNLTNGQEKDIKKLFNDIIKEAKHYKKNIKEFVRNNGL
jgi:Fe-S-cluster containining protein